MTHESALLRSAVEFCSCAVLGAVRVAAGGRRQPSSAGCRRLIINATMTARRSSRLGLSNPLSIPRAMLRAVCRTLHRAGTEWERSRDYAAANCSFLRVAVAFDCLSFQQACAHSVPLSPPPHRQITGTNSSRREMPIAHRTPAPRFQSSPWWRPLPPRPTLVLRSDAAFLSLFD